MGSLQDELLKAGLVSTEAHQRAQDRERSRTQQQLPNQDKFLGRGIDELDHVKTIHEFRASARTLLETDPSCVKSVIAKAQRFRDHEGGMKLLWLLHQIKDGLGALPEKEHHDFLRRALRKHGATFETD